VSISKKVGLPNGWQDAIYSRGKFVSEALGLSQGECNDWYACLERLVLKENGLYLTWLVITGCYPNKLEFQKFILDFQIRGLEPATSTLLRTRAQNTVMTQLILRVIFVKSTFPELVDITHTSHAPFLTGIQRVAFGVTSEIQGISTFAWLGSFGVMTDLDKAHSGNLDVAKTRWRVKFVRYSHIAVPILNKTRAGKRIVRALLPIARKIKYLILSNEATFLLRKSNVGKVENILVLNTRITVPEIPSSDHIQIYEVMLEQSIIPVQIILYDFIPLFHAWTVHRENRGSLNIYLRLVLLADRVISISRMVQEQAMLISEAFKLERQEWINRPQVFKYLSLPSGLSPAKEGEFVKQPLLVVMAGSLEPRKNHVQFLSALEILHSRGIQVEGVILGSAGWENSHILERIHELQDANINIRREVNLSDDEMRHWIGKAQVLLQISEAEGFGLPVSEALSLGTRVIVSDIRPLNEWVGNGVQSVKLGDAEGLADLISKIVLFPDPSPLNFRDRISWQDWANLLYFS